MNISSFVRKFIFVLALGAGIVALAAGQTSKLSPARPPEEDEEESGEEILERQKYFYTRRAGGPGKTIPEGAYERAAAQHQALVKQRKESGVDGILPAWISANPGGLWYFVTDANYISGRTNSITWSPADPTTMYLGAAGGGVWKTTDDGVTWVPITDQLSSLATGAVVADPNDENILYLGTGELNYSLDSYYGDGLYKSTDAGASWFKLFDTFLGRYFSQIVVNPANSSIVYTASNQGVFKSTNGGAGWSNTASGTFVNSLVMDGSNTEILYASTGATGLNSIKKTTNGGASWTTLTTGLPTTTMGRTTLAIASSNPQVVYASISHRTTNALAGVYRTTNGGTSWTLQANTPNYLGSQGWYGNSIVVDPDNENTIAVGGLDVYVSTNAGVTFDQKSLWFTNDPNDFTHADIHYLGYSNGYLYCGSDGGVYRSPDNGNTWSDMNATISTLQFQSADYDPTDPSKMVGGTQDNNIEHTTNGGANWYQYTTGDGGYTVIDPVTPDFVYSQYVLGSVERSINGGISFEEISPSGASGGLFYNPYELAPGNHNVMVYGQANVWKTGSVQTATSFGSEWTQILPNPGGNVSAIGISKTDDGKIYIGTDNGRILATANNGGTWSVVSTGTPYVTDLAVDPVNDSVCYATFGGFGASTHIYKTTNRGAAWSNITSNLPNIPVNSIVIRSVLPRMLMIGTDLGVYISKNDGASWSAFNSGLPTVAVFDLKYRDGNKILLAATHGRGVFTYDLSGFSFGASPTVLPFGGVLLNTTKTDTVTVTNTGTASFTVTSVSSDNAVFTVNPASGAIAPAASMKFAVTYHPLTEGPAAGTLTFTHTGITSPDIVSVSGTGSTPKFTASVAAKNFGTLLIGLSKTDSVTISNPGNVALNISAVNSTNTDFTVAPPSGSVPPLGSMKFYVTYYATATGTSSGTIIFDHNGTSTPDSVSVSGIGGVATAQFIKLEDADGDLATTGDRVSRKWSFSVYQNSVSPGNLIGSGDSSRVTIFLPAGGTYILAEADSGLAWGRINANQQRFDTLAFIPGSMAVDTFINRRYSAFIPIADKWNMLSLPVIVNDSSYTTLFPHATTSPFKYTSSYQFSQYFSKGIGYWLKFSGARSYNFAGTPVESLVIDTRIGWNLIGTPASPVLASDIVQVPPGIVYTPYFRYSTIYSVADTLFPGHAYWVKTSQAGNLIMSSGQVNQPAAAQVNDFSSRMSGLTIEDAAGVAQTLFISSRAIREGFSYEMPPHPPEGEPDVRFASGRIVEKYDAKSDNSYPLSVSGLKYPIVLSWDDNESFALPLRISWNIGGRHFDHLLEDGGRVMVSDTAASDFTAELRSRLPLPTSFSLEQNYPNPFNPVTVIRYSLPADVAQDNILRYNVSLRVYNLLGQLVATLVDEEQTPGYKSLTFDASNLPSGMYIYKLSAGSFNQARKMVVVK